MKRNDNVALANQYNQKQEEIYNWYVSAIKDSLEVEAKYLKKEEEQRKQLVKSFVSKEKRQKQIKELEDQLDYIRALRKRIVKYALRNKDSQDSTELLVVLEHWTTLLFRLANELGYSGLGGFLSPSHEAWDQWQAEKEVAEEKLEAIIGN